MPTEEIKQAILEEIRPHFGAFRDVDAMLDFLFTLNRLKPELFRFWKDGRSYPVTRIFVLPEFEKHQASRAARCGQLPGRYQ
ncbi:MAG: hypothetical protein K0Q91_191 [Fibrobacteria bacterium]|jgi:hypothetical protein|nr:hypothetical protein [Fibrobacteria bacterium]